MHEPDTTTLWKESFTVNATVFYITEPVTAETLVQICTQIRCLTYKDPGCTPYFLVLFPGGVSPLFFSPQKALCSGFINGELSPPLTRARQHITETVTDLIAQCIKADLLPKE